MTPQRDEAQRMLRLAHRDAVAFAALFVAPGVALPVALFHAQQASEKAWAQVQTTLGSP